MPATWDKDFAPYFYAHWGKENCVIGARTSKALYPPFEQRLSIKAAWGGRENYFIDNRCIPVDDDTFLILNDSRTYSSSIRATAPVTSLGIFFRPGMSREVQRTLGASHDSLMDDPEAGSGSGMEFSEQLRRHHPKILPILRFILRHVDVGVVDEDWYEEQLYFLLQRMYDLQRADEGKLQSISAVKLATRRELFRRLALATDLINSRYSSALTLEKIASAAMLSRFHFLRLFRELYGITPMEYLRNCRLDAAVRLLQSGTHSVGEVAGLVGFQSRTTFFRQMKARFAIPPQAHLRKLRIDDETQYVGGAPRPATRQRPDNIEGAESVDGADHHAHHDNRTQHRQGEEAEHPPGRGAVDRGGLERLPRQALQPGQQQ